MKTINSSNTDKGRYQLPLRLKIHGSFCVLNLLGMSLNYSIRYTNRCWPCFLIVGGVQRNSGSGNTQCTSTRVGYSSIAKFIFACAGSINKVDISKYTKI